MASTRPTLTTVPSYTIYPYAGPDSRPSVPEANVKKLYLIRHSQGTHNLAVLNSGGTDGGLTEVEYKNEAWSDARLTELGRTQSASLVPVVAALPTPDVVLVSPLSRAIQTGSIAYQGTQVPFVCEELVRERNGAHPCDRRRGRVELTQDFPFVDFSTLTAEADDTWTVEREPWDKTVGRATAFLAKVAAMPQATIAVVTHNDFLQALLLEAPELRASDPSLRKKFNNAECMPLWLVHSMPGGEGEGRTGPTSPPHPHPEASPRTTA